MSNKSILVNIEKSIIRYKKNRDEIRRNLQNKKNKVYLGRSFAQLDFQYYLALNLFKKSKYDKVLVDTGVSFRGSGFQPLYPDILLLKNSQLKAILDIKIDLGFLRYEDYGIKYNKQKKMYGYERKKNKFKKRYKKFLSSKMASYKINNEYDKKEDFYFKIPNYKKVKKLFILITKENDHSRFDTFFKSMDNSGFKFLVLLKDCHPGVPKTTIQDIKSGLKENEKDIRKFLKPLIKL